MPVSTTHGGCYSLLTLELPGRETLPAGILLLDTAADRLHLRLRRDWDLIAPEEAEVLAELEDDFAMQAVAHGAAAWLAQLEDTLSNTLRLGDRREVMIDDFPRALARLYRRHVSAEVQEFRTHLPRYSLAVAAGPFLENQTVEKEGWEEIPPGLRLTEEMFVARIAGQSMEPLIADGSLCVFRRGPRGGALAGSRQGRLVLVEALGEAGNDRYTVKRYRSEKGPALGDPGNTERGNNEEWTHHRIRLEALNPDFPAWDLTPAEDRYRILAEFVQVID